jgi:Glycosyl hydrolase catalytic core
VLVGSPEFAATGESYVPATAEGRLGFRRFVRDVVRRYGHGGRFWRLHKKLPRRPVSAYQVWNEPNYPPHWGDGPSDAAAYGAFLKDQASVIRHYDPRATIATAGLLASSTRGPPGYRYLADLYKVPGIRRAFDAVAVHPYAEDTAGVEGELSRIRAVMRSHGDGRTPLWISELGWATGGGNPYFTTTPAQQAARLTSAFRFVVRNRARYRVGRLVWFSWRDRVGRPSRGWEFYCGLFDTSGKPKPAWAAFRRFTRATR